MAKITPKRKHTLRNIILAVAALPILFILYIIGTLLLSPVFDTADKSRFEKLDNQSRELYSQLQVASGGAELWTYVAGCEDMNRGVAGFYFTTDYACTTEVFTEVPISTLSQFLSLQDKYYLLIDQSKMMNKVSELDMQRPGDFGMRFVSSSAEKKYKTDDGITCTYLVNLSDGKNIDYGINLSVGNALVGISLRCTDTSRGDWYAG